MLKLERGAQSGTPRHVHLEEARELALSTDSNMTPPAR